MNIRLCAILLPLLLAAYCSLSQDTSGIANARLVNLYADNISAKSAKIDQQMDKYTQKVLSKAQKQDARIKRKLEKIDSVKAASVFADTEQQYKQLQTRIEKSVKLQHYIPSLDSLSTSMKFLQENEKLIAATKDGKKKITEALEKIKGVEGQFQKAEEIKNYLKQRKEYLREQLSGLGFGKELKKLSKQSYYAVEQFNEYKSLLKNYTKAEKKMIALLSKTFLFKEFMRKNSQLASLFRLSGDPNDPTNLSSLTGLQTSAQVNNMIQQQLTAAGPNAMAQIQQNMQQAQSQLHALKDRLIKTGAGSGSSDDIMPDGFKPNRQKTRSFLKRLELGANIQSQKSSVFFPSTTDLGMTIGYKLTDRSIIGIGTSYKLGLGKDIRHVKLSHQGVGIRSFVDWKIKGSFWLSGGYEMNYRSEFRQVQALRDLNAWQSSGLIGLSKVVSLRTNLLKKTKLQLLWDFLSYQQKLRTQPVVFRMGYSF